MRNSHRAFVSTLCGGFVASLLGCSGAQTYQPRSSAIANSSDARIVANASKEEGQTRLDLTIEHLAPPDRVADRGARYVVWYRHDDSRHWKRVGVLDYDVGSRRGQLAQTTVPELAFDLEVTDESSNAPEDPSSAVVVSQHVVAN
jgi:hypothetical protein